MNVELQIMNLRRRLTWRGAARLCAVVAFALFSCALDLTAQTNNNNSAPTYDSFNIISQRNIFDPNRRGIQAWHAPAPSHNPDIFTLVGTMSYAKGKFAFFDGTKSDYKKVLEPG